MSSNIIDDAILRIDEPPTDYVKRMVGDDSFYALCAIVGRAWAKVEYPDPAYWAAHHAARVVYCAVLDYVNARNINVAGLKEYLGPLIED